ncbi:MAG TPA: type I glutamate--ammonia ligase [Thermoplasmata archaeon]|nr:type I glutamate--ammonia ligase [Thermoplasmata archaeon]
MADEDPRTHVLETAKTEKVQFVQIMFMDLLGFVKTVTIPTSKLERALNEGVVFDGSSVVGYATIEESDMRAHPVPETFRVFPWTNGDLKTAGIVCNIYDAKGDRFAGDPRYILERLMKHTREMGYVPHTGPEYEFFLFKIGPDGRPTNTPSDTGRYFEQLPMDAGEMVRKKASLYGNAMGFDVEATHHEVAPGQHELDLRYADAMTSADRVVFLKHLIRTVALEHGLHATFMPKPIFGVNGTGMHVHQSLITPHGENAFYEPTAKWEMSELMLHYLAGILAHARETCAVLASWVNSYKRLVPGYEAPVYISWANKNRSAMVRIPQGRGMSTRMEVRNPDSAGNPYLQYASMIAAGLSGIEKKLDPPGPIETDIYHLTAVERKKLGIASLPANLEEALEEFERSEVMRETLGSHVFPHFLYLKRQEWDDYRIHVTDYEIEKYLPIL